MCSVTDKSVDQGVRPAHVALGGDSAGAILAIGTLQRLRAQRQPMPAACPSRSATALAR